MTNRRAAFLAGLLMAALYAYLAACAAPTRPLVTCHARVIDTQQGPWPVGQSCDATDPRTGQGHAVTP